MPDGLPGTTVPPIPAIDPRPARPAGSPGVNGVQTGTATGLAGLIALSAMYYGGVPAELAAAAVPVLGGLFGWIGSWARHRAHAGDPLPADAVLRRVG